MKSNVNHANSVTGQQSPNLRLSHLKTRRKNWLGVHIWLGLSLGLLLSIYGITGSILVFHKAVAIAMQRYPTGRPHSIYGAPEPTKTYTVCQNGVDAPGSLLQRRCLVMDRYSGKILDVDDPTIGTAGEVFTQWQWPLHSGRAFGMTGRVLVFLSGLACPVLFVTGVIRWQQKRRAKKSKPRKKPELSSKRSIYKQPIA
jgi:uncharacterized iron-regulated membrane protein